MISTLAPATTPPEESLTAPSIDPALPNWAFAGPAASNRTNPRTKTTLLLKRFNIFSPSLSRFFILSGKRPPEKRRWRRPSVWPAHGNTLQARGEELSGRRCASGAMQRKGIAWRCVLRQRRKPRDHLRRADEIQPGSRQRRHVQRLADMASVLRSIRMLVEERAARDKIEQCGASQQRQRAARSPSPENCFLQIHLSTLYLTTLDGPMCNLVANRTPAFTKSFP